jgi:hypothetical protein
VWYQVTGAGAGGEKVFAVKKRWWKRKAFVGAFVVI